MERKEVVVIGLGVIGLPTAFMFARSGCCVYGVDANKELISKLKDKTYNLPDDLKALEGIRTLTFTTQIPDKAVDYIVVCVGVNIDDNKNPMFKEFDLLVRKIGLFMNKGVTISFETTLPPGTTKNRILPLLEKTSNMVCGEDFFLVYSPERVTLERLVYNMERIPRVVGGYTDKCKFKGSNLYARICRDLKVTDLTTAEMTKLTENTYRDVNIAYANEVAAICDECGVDFLEVRDLVNSLPDIPDDEFINPVRNLHFAGVGVGGYCLPKDPHLLRTIKPSNLERSIIQESRKLNDEVPKYIAAKVFRLAVEFDLVKDKKDCNILILGAAAIRNTGDCRNSPTNLLVGELAKMDFINEIRVYDPHIPEYAIDCKEFIREKAKFIILATPHKLFENMFSEKILHELKTRRVILNSEDVLDEK